MHAQNETLDRIHVSISTIAFLAVRSQYKALRSSPVGEIKVTNSFRPLPIDGRGISEGDAAGVQRRLPGNG